MNHSPLPWRRAQYAGTAGIDDANGSSVADAVTDADAELILRAVNSYDDLVAAYQSILAATEIDLIAVLDGDDNEPVYDSGDWFTIGLLNQLRAAIRKAIGVEAP